MQHQETRPQHPTASRQPGCCFPFASPSSSTTTPSPSLPSKPLPDSHSRSTLRQRRLLRPKPRSKLHSQVGQGWGVSGLDAPRVRLHKSFSIPRLARRRISAENAGSMGEWTENVEQAFDVTGNASVCVIVTRLDRGHSSLRFEHARGEQAHPSLGRGALSSPRLTAVVEPSP